MLEVLLPSSAGEAVRDVAEVMFLPPPSLQLVTSGKEIIIRLTFVNADSHSAKKSRKVKYSGQAPVILSMSKNIRDKEKFPNAFIFLRD